METNMQVTQDMVDSFLVTKNLDFTVQMVPTFGQVSVTKEDGTLDTEMKPLGAFAPMRTDTNTFLSSGGLSKDFTPIQNRDAFKIITQLAGVTNIELKNGGQWSNGAGVFAQVSLGSMNVGNGDDKVGKYLSIVNSHDGSRALTILITPYRFFCMNQIAKAVNKAKKNENSFISIRHNASAEERIHELIRTVHIADDSFQYSEEVYNKLAQLKINEEYVKEALTRLFPIEHNDGRGKTIWENRMQGVKNRFMFADAGRIERDTAWNLYNAIQGTVQHDSRNTATKMRSVLMGSIAQQSSDIMTTVLDVCSSEHIPASVSAEIEAMMAGVL
jgi:phage/plasmid-like protein (TIGR03299 family)